MSRTKQYIPRKQSMPKIRKPKQQSKKTIREHIPVGEIKGIDKHELAKRINLIFTLADVMESVAMDVESTLKKTDDTIVLPLVHPTQRIKIHSNEMVSFVDETLKLEQAIGFGDLSDIIKEGLFESFDITT